MLRERLGNGDNPFGSGSRGRGRSRNGSRALFVDLGDLGLGSDGLGGAVHKDTVSDESLEQPVVGAVAGDALVDTILAQVKVAVITRGAVVMGVGDCFVTAVAAYCEVADRIRRGIERWLGRLVEE